MHVLTPTRSWRRRVAERDGGVDPGAGRMSTATDDLCIFIACEPPSVQFGGDTSAATARRPRRLPRATLAWRRGLADTQARATNWCDCFPAGGASNSSRNTPGDPEWITPDDVRVGRTKRQLPLQ